MTSSDQERSPKDKADVPPVLPSEQPSGSDVGRALTPEELDFTDSPLVAEVENGRFVVSADGPPAISEQNVSGTDNAGSAARKRRSTATEESTPAAEQSASAQSTQSSPSSGQAQAQAHQVREIRTRESPEAARSLLADELERSDAKYAFDIVSTFGDNTITHRTASDDVVGTFDNLVLWYAQNVPTKASTMRTTTLLMEKSEFGPDLSSNEIKRVAKRAGLTRSSTIGDLLDELE